jgi:hypothetical protein
MKYGSLKRRPDSVFISRRNIYYDSLSTFRPLYKNEATPFSFFEVNKKFFYMNGNHQVFETTIMYPSQVYFDAPDLRCQEVGMGYVYFTPMHKIEWLFL